MLYNTLHNRWLRIVAAVVGELIAAAALNLFIVPLNLYTGGIMGVCQLIRTFLQTQLGVTFGAYDIAGILYFLVNVPILLFAYKSLGLGLVAKTIICTVSYSLFYSIIPIPSAPIVDDYLTACLILFSPEVAIYSVIYNFFASMVLDRMHQQNVNVMALIFTHADEHILGQFIIDKLNRGVTYWNGTGAYTGQGVHVLCVSLSKYEIEELLHAVRSIDPQAFLTVQEGVHVYGNFRKKLE